MKKTIITIILLTFLTTGFCNKVNLNFVYKSATETKIASQTVDMLSKISKNIESLNSMNQSDWISIFFNVVLAIINIGLFVIAFRALSISRKQLLMAFKANLFVEKNSERYKVRFYNDNSLEILSLKSKIPNLPMIKIVNIGEPAHEVDLIFFGKNSAKLNSWKEKCLNKENLVKMKDLTKIESGTLLDKYTGEFPPIYRKSIEKDTPEKFSYIIDSDSKVVPFGFVSYACFLLKEESNEGLSSDELFSFYENNLIEFFISIGLYYKSRINIEHPKPFLAMIMIPGSKCIKVTEEFLEIEFCFSAVSEFDLKRYKKTIPKSLMF